MFAALGKRFDIVEWLVKLGCSKLLKDKNGQNAYQIAMASSDPEVVANAAMLTDRPQKVVSITLVERRSRELVVMWSDPLKNYEEEEMDYFKVEMRALSAVAVNPAYIKYKIENGKRLSADPSAITTAAAPFHGHQGSSTARAATAPSGSSAATRQSSHSGSSSKRGRGGGRVRAHSRSQATRPSNEHNWTVYILKRCPWTSSGLVPNMPYHIRVTPHSKAGYGPPSREVLVTTAEEEPSAPTQPPFLVSATPTSITVGWVPSKYENGHPIYRYDIQRMILAEDGAVQPHVGSDYSSAADGDGDNVMRWVTFKTGDATALYQAGGLPMYAKCKFRVRGVNAVGEGPWSDISTSFQAQDIIQVIERDARWLYLKWYNKPEMPTTKWELQRRPFVYGTDFRGDESKEWELAADDIEGGVTGEVHYKCLNLLPGSDYQFRLRGLQADGGWQRWRDSAVSGCTKTKSCPPDPPHTLLGQQVQAEDLQIDPGQPHPMDENSVITSIQLSWKAGRGNGAIIDEHEVWGSVDGGDWSREHSAGVESTTFIHNLSPGKVYRYRVRCHNELGWGEFSMPTPPLILNPLPPCAPPDLRRHGVTWLELEWSKPPGQQVVQSYELQVAGSGPRLGEWLSVGSGAEGEEVVYEDHLLLADLKPGSSYRVRVRAKTFFGWSPFSRAASFTTERRY
ncbi:unnamed protein product [Chrysoparadoxa australica]